MSLGCGPSDALDKAVVAVCTDRIERDSNTTDA